MSNDPNANDPNANDPNANEPLLQGPQPTEPKLFEQLKFLTESQRELHKNRRQIEQRIHFVSLTVFLLAGFAVLKGDIQLVANVKTYIAIWSAFLFLIGLSGGYLYWVHRANYVNLLLAELAEDKIWEFVGMEKQRDAILALHIKNKGKNKDVQQDQQQVENRDESATEGDQVRTQSYWSFIWQFSSILIVGIACALVMTMQTIPESDTTNGEQEDNSAEVDQTKTSDATN